MLIFGDTHRGREGTDGTAGGDKGSLSASLMSLPSGTGVGSETAAAATAVGVKGLRFQGNFSLMCPRHICSQSVPVSCPHSLLLTIDLPGFGGQQPENVRRLGIQNSMDLATL